MLSIGTLAKRTGTKVQTIRYYEQIGLLPEPGRTEGGQRRYGDADLDRLAFIRHARQLGFTLEPIRELLNLSDNPERSCAEVDAIAQRQLREVEARIARLEALRSELRRMLRECQADRVADCRVLEVLRDPAECLTDHDRIGTRYRPRSSFRSRRWPRSPAASPSGLVAERRLGALAVAGAGASAARRRSRRSRRG